MKHIIKVLSFSVLFLPALATAQSSERDIKLQLCYDHCDDYFYRKLDECLSRVKKRYKGVWSISDEARAKCEEWALEHHRHCMLICKSMVDPGVHPPSVIDLLQLQRRSPRRRGA